MSEPLATPVLGVNVDLVDTTQVFELGTTVTGTDGNRYQYVEAGAAISTTTNEPYALCIDEDYSAIKGTAAGALDNHAFGVAPRLVIGSGEFFWARLDGNAIPIRVAASVGADVVLGFGASATAGRLQASVTASAGNAIVYGVMITAAASASASAGNTIRTAIVTNPIYKTAVAN